MRKRTTRLAVVLVSAGFAAAGCQNEGRQESPGAAAVPSVEQRGVRMDDTAKTTMVLRQIHAVNQDEIETGKIAVERAQNPEVKRYGNQMVTDHTNADQRLTELARRANVDLGPSAQTPVEAAFAAASDSTRRMLRDLSGAQFDVAYLAPQAHLHEFAIQVVDQGQKFATGDTKRLLDETKPVLEGHLEHARTLMRGLSFAPTAVGGGPMGSERTEPAPAGTVPGMGRGDAGIGGRQQPGRPAGGGTRPTP